jgi:23S rRNA pseudouridine2604 synthase
LNQASISLNKFISDTGYCSRREADNLIIKGRVLLNDKPAQLGNRYTPGDSVEVDGSLITTNNKPAKKEKLIYMAFNKPVGITTTTEENIRGNIITYINHPKRIFPIGRLDKDSEGLIFLTNDGDIVNKILRAGNNHEKEYIVKVNKAVDYNFINKMAAGVRIKDGLTKPCIVKKVSNHTFRITLTQGLNRQIRKMCEAFDYKVMSLQRVRIMHITLGKIALGKWRYLSDVEVAQLQDMVKTSKSDY